MRDPTAKWSDARAETHRALLREALHQIDHAHGIGVHLCAGAVRARVRTRPSVSRDDGSRRSEEASHDIDDDRMRAEKKTDSFA